MPPYLGERVVSRGTGGRFTARTLYRDPRTGRLVTRFNRARIEAETNVEQFNAALQHFKDLSGAKINQLLTAHVLNFVARAQVRAPVRKGRFKNSIHAVPPNTTDRFTYRDNDGKSYDGSLGVRTGPGEAIAGTNVPYAIALEAGHSKQAPTGVFAVTLKEMTGELEREIARELTEMWNSL